MRKKYLSALLFGALLVTSAGTFTSCKDYDDDIKNLQEQIDVIKTDLASLTETVNNLDGVKDMSFTDGKLVIETGNGKKVEVDIPSASGIAKVELKDNVLYVNDEPQGEVVIPEDVDVKVEVKEDGKLYINDEVQNLEIGSKIVMVDNGDYYTMTIDGKESYNLPKYSPAALISSLSVTSALTFESSVVDKPISYNFLPTANDAMKNWKGPKGAVANNQLMIGSIGVAEKALKVAPATVDMSSLKLSLLDSKGNEAPVTVNAVANDDLLVSESRAAGNGIWNLVLTIDDTVNSSNIATSFDNEDGNAILYALAVDGKVMTDYDIVIDVAKNSTDLNLDQVGKILVNGEDLYEKVNDDNRADIDLKLGENTLEITGTTSFKVYDAYIELEDEDQAGAYNVTTSGMTINAPESAAGQDFKAIIHILTLTGQELELYTTMNVAGSEVGEEEIAPQSYKFSSDLVTDKKVVVDLGNTFTALTSAQANAVNNHITWTLDDKAKTIASIGSVLYFEKLEDAKKEAEGTDTGKELDMATAATIKKAKYAVMPFTFKAQADVTTGDNKVTIKLTDGTNEVKKVSTVLTFALPSFEELFPRTSQWNGDTYSTKLGEDFKFNYAFAFNEADGYSYDDLTVAYTKVGDVTVINENSDKKLGTDGLVELSGNVLNNNTKKLITDKLETTLTYTFTNTNLKVESKFTTEIHSTFENPKLVYYVDGEVQDKAVLGEGNVISPLTIDSETGIKNGLAIQYGRGEKAFALDVTVDGVKIANSAAANQVQTDLSIKNSTANNNTLGDGGVTINSNVASGTLVAKFTDINGVVTEATIDFE